MSKAATILLYELVYFARAESYGPIEIQPRPETLGATWLGAEQGYGITSNPAGSGHKTSAVVGIGDEYVGSEVEMVELEDEYYPESEIVIVIAD